MILNRILFNFFQLVVALMLFLVLTNCSMPIVHLHANDISRDKGDQILQLFQVSKIKIKNQKNEHPNKSLGTIVIYHPYKKNDEFVTQLVSQLDSIGIHVDSIVLDEYGKHKYTKNNIGLYISEAPTAPAARITSVPIREEFPIKLTDNEFTSIDCGDLYILEFDMSGIVLLSNISSVNDVSRTLSWRYDDNEKNNLVIHDSGTDFEYAIDKYHEVQNNGRRVEYTITLSAKGYYSIPLGCKFKSDFFEVI